MLYNTVFPTADSQTVNTYRNGTAAGSQSDNYCGLSAELPDNEIDYYNLFHESTRVYDRQSLFRFTIKVLVSQ